MKMRTSYPQILFLLTCIMLSITCFIVPIAGGTINNNTSNHSKNKYSCISHEREALLEFKHGVIDKDGVLTSWGDHDDQRDCCQWNGVSCSSLTGQFIGLDLSFMNLGGSISSALANMSALSHLDLSFNQFLGPFPMFLANMGGLSYLNLAVNQFEGVIPAHVFGNMSALSYLDLSGNQFEGLIPANVIGNLSALSYLDLSNNQFVGLTQIPASFLRNMSILSHPELFYSRFERSGWPSNILGNLCSLKTLSLSNNSMGDELSTILNAFFGLCANNSLVELKLSNNQIWGSVPDTIGTFSSLDLLDISNNQLNGTISDNLGKLSTLVTLDLYDNFLQGTLSHNHFLNLSMLGYLDVSRNPSLVVDISSDWIPPFQLLSISMSSCKLGPRFPKWLLTQKYYFHLDISNTGISDTIPPSFFNSLSSNMILFNMSLNKIYGVLPNEVMQFSYTFNPDVDLSSNLFEGTIPSFAGNFSSLLLNNNKFTNVTPLLCPDYNINVINLDLSSNLLLGELPNCWTKFSRLESLHLENNKFSGNLPISIGAFRNLNFLHLRNNSFSGELFPSLKSCRNLTILDAGYNSFIGHIPRDIGSNFGNIGILNLRSNNFSGRLPLSLCKLLYLQVLDISSNYISGTIPSCIKGFRAMTIANHSSYILQGTDEYYFLYADDAMVMWKGREYKYKNNLGLVKSIDVSHNKLEGQIPSSISSLKGLVSLDLSGNLLTGCIPSEIGELVSIEFFDLSSNHLSGHIPESLANMNSLGVLDLSNNNLSGKIPSGTQLQSFDALSYMGNPRLCGPPLQNCPGDDPPSAKAHRGNQDENNVTDHDDIFPGLYISVVFGFIIGFWGVCGTLVIKRSWRIAYFRFVDNLKDTIW